MRWGIIADVHANVEALRAVLEDARGRVDRWWFLGDAVGRGPSPIDVLKVLREIVSLRHWQVGNHDLYVVGRLSQNRLNPRDRMTLEDHEHWLRRERLRAKERTWSWWRWCRQVWHSGRVRPQCLEVRGRVDVWLVHAVLDETNERCAGVGNSTYLMPWDIVDGEPHARIQWSRLLERRRDGRGVVLLHGHTHVPYVAVKIGERPPLLMPIQYGHPFDLTRYDAVMINPGSVGQPRHGEAGAFYGILDTEHGTFEFRRVEYDSTNTRAQMRARGYSPDLIHLLEGDHPRNPLRGKVDLWRDWRSLYRPTSEGWEPAR